MKNITKNGILVCFIALFFNVSHAQTNSSTQSFRTNLYVVNSGTSKILIDGNLVQYKTGYNASVDYLDAIKLNNMGETFALLRDGVTLSIERRPPIAIADTLYYHFTHEKTIKYALEFISTGLKQGGVTAMLQDSYTNSNTAVSLDSSAIVYFNISTDAASQNPNRFKVVFSESQILPVNFSGITVSQQEVVSQVSWSVENELNIKQYLIERSSDAVHFVTIGTVNSIGNNSASKYNWIDNTVQPGNYFYRVAAIETGGTSIYSPIVNTKSSSEKQSLKICPNPVQDGIVRFVFNGMATGEYTIRIINLWGQEITKQIVQNTGEGAIQIIHLNKNIQKGIYQVEAIGTTNQRTYLKLLCN